jgi:hypothetical protein
MLRRTRRRTQSIWLDSEGLIHAQVKPLELELEDAREAVREIALLGQGRKRPVLVDLRQCKSIAVDARAYLAGPETARVELAAAVVIVSRLKRMLGNLVMRLRRPLVPTRLCTSEGKALDWLRGFVRHD